MKRLYLVRHAKSGEHPGLRDEDRPLNDRGLSDALFMAHWLMGAIDTPDRIMASTAVRARQTAVVFARIFHVPEQDIQLEQRIYEASVLNLLRITTSFSDTLNSIILVGHNPGITDYIRVLTDHFTDEMATCSIAALSLEVQSWQETASGTGHLDFMVHPKELRPAGNG